MSIEEVTEVCRLCLKKDDLVAVLDKRFEHSENIKDVILITTGVEIQSKDFVSQKICQKCRQISLKMFQFRQTSMRNDKHLKDKYLELTKNGGVKIPNTSIIIRSEKQSPKSEKKKIPSGFKNIHPSVEEIFKKYPNIRLPHNCLRMNIAPSVAMKMNEVEIYFKKRNINMKRQVFYALRALKAEKEPASPKDEEKQKSENKATPKIHIDENQSVQKNSAISPINIKLTDPNKAQYQIIKKTDDSKDKLKCDLKRKLSQSSSSDESDYAIWKRKKITEASNSSEIKENKKPNLMESLGLKPLPPKPKVDSPGPVQVPRVERQCQVCEVCNSVQYSIKDLKKHQLKHLRCQFCKVKFKTLSLKQEHIEKVCVVKKMNNLPTIDLHKIEYDLELRKKYPNAFVGFPLIPGIDVDEPKQDDPPTEERECTEMNNILSELESETNKDSDIIILSDDDESNNSNVDPIARNEKTSNKSVSELTKPLQIPSNPLIPEKSGTLSTIPVRENSAQPTIPQSVSSSIVKPDIRIKNNHVLDTIDTKDDMHVMKELLRNYRKLKLNKDAATQHELPSNVSIKISLHDYTAVLKGFKNQLQTYRIPVEVKHGTYRVSFEYTPKLSKQKSTRLWNHLIPIDLKKPIPKTNNPITNFRPVFSSGHSAFSNISGSTRNVQTASQIAPTNISSSSKQTFATTSQLSSNNNSDISNVSHSSGLQSFNKTTQVVGPSKNTANALPHLIAVSNSVPIPNVSQNPAVSNQTMNNLTQLSSANKSINMNSNICISSLLASSPNIQNSTSGFSNKPRNSLPYPPSNTVLLSQNSSLSKQDQCGYHSTHSTSSATLYPSNNYVPSNSINNAYVPNTSVFMPNDFPQFLVPPTPLRNTSSSSNASPVETISIHPSSNIPSTIVNSCTSAVTNSQVTTAVSPCLVSSAPLLDTSAGSNVTAVEAVSHSSRTPVVSSVLNFQIPVISTVATVVNNSNFSQSNLSNNTNNSAMTCYLTNNNVTTESSRKSPPVVGMPLIRVKNLTELK